MKKEEGYNVSELGNWNVASDFSRLKVMKPLYLCDLYENVARFGHDNFLDQLENLNLPMDVLRLNGFVRLVNELLKLIKNTKFAMKKGKTKEDMEGHEEKLKKILKTLPALSKTIVNNRRNTKQVKINNERYNAVLDIVLEIKSKINEPLNKNHLIFTDKEEFDPRKYKSQIIDGAVSRG